MDRDIKALFASPYIAGSFAFAIILLLLVVILSSRKSASRKGNTLLLVGAADSGKTSIFSALVYDQPLPSHTSLQTNSSTFTLPNAKSMNIVDVPGHARIRDQFREHIGDAKFVAFVVDASTISRNAATVAEHLHIVMHALTNLPPSQALPTLLVLAHKCDLLKTGSTSSDVSAEQLAVNRVRNVLERELEQRRSAQSDSLGIEKIGAEEEKTDTMGGLECTGPTFSFAAWEGGECNFVGTSIKTLKDGKNGLAGLIEILRESM